MDRMAEIFEGFNLRWLLSLLIPIGVGLYLMRSPETADTGLGILLGSGVTGAASANQTAFRKALVAALAFAALLGTNVPLAHADTETHVVELNGVSMVPATLVEEDEDRNFLAIKNISTNEALCVLRGLSVENYSIKKLGPGSYMAWSGDDATNEIFCSASDDIRFEVTEGWRD